jgi:hypothetical protein
VKPKPKLTKPLASCVPCSNSNSFVLCRLSCGVWTTHYALRPNAGWAIGYRASPQRPDHTPRPHARRPDHTPSAQPWPPQLVHLAPGAKGIWGHCLGLGPLGTGASDQGAGGGRCRCPISRPARWPAWSVISDQADQQPDQPLYSRFAVGPLKDSDSKSEVGREQRRAQEQNAGGGLSHWR